MNQIAITLQADAPQANIDRAHAALDAFFGRAYNREAGAAHLDSLAPQGAASIETVAAKQADVQLDAEGLPHDERIHAGTKTMTQKGLWTKKKGVDDATIARVTAELRQFYPAPVADVPAVAAITAPTINIAPKTEYQKLTEFLATNVGKGNLTQALVDATFKQNNTSLAALAGNEAHSTAFLEAFIGVLNG